MTERVHPEFFKAFDHYKAMVKQYGDAPPYHRASPHFDNALHA